MSENERIADALQRHYGYATPAAVGAIAALLRAEPVGDKYRPYAVAYNRLISMMAQVYGEEGFALAPAFLREALLYAGELALGIEEDWSEDREREIVALDPAYRRRTEAAALPSSAPTEGGEPE